jgi:hypothetical protein
MFQNKKRTTNFVDLFSFFLLMKDIELEVEVVFEK